MTAAHRGGAGKCATCAHAQLVAIDADLVAGVPYRQLAKRYGISTRSLLRHKNAHLGKEVVALPSTHLTEASSALSALTRVETLYAGLAALWDVAAADLQSGAMLAIAREIRANIELLAKLTGELNEKPQHLTLNLLANDQFFEVVKVILESWEDHPEAKRALIQRLRVLNEEEK